jgi:hypothetical protein
VRDGTRHKRRKEIKKQGKKNVGGDREEQEEEGEEVS